VEHLRASLSHLLLLPIAATLLLLLLRLVLADCRLL
jgi:hypothetical protein